MEKAINHDSIDEALLPFHSFAAALSEFDGFAIDQEAGFNMNIEEVIMEMPLLVDVVDNDDGSLTLGAAPPLYYLATGVDSVYHQIKLTVTVTNHA